jgi:hypothetical protein
LKLSSNTIIALVGLAVGLPMFFMPPKGHDVINHIIIFKLFAEQVLSGDYFPRWLMKAENGFGSPAISYFPILHYYLSLPFYPLIKYGEHLPVFASATFAVILSGIFMNKYLLLKTTKDKALLAAIFYMVFPYHIGVDYYFRFAFSEIWVLALFPLALFFCEKKSFLGTALTSAAIFLTHLLLAPILCSLLIALCILQKQKRLIWPILLGAAISAFHNYPAALNSELVSSQLGLGVYDYTKNFIDYHNVQGILFCVIALITVVCISKTSYFWSAVLLGSIFMCFEYSGFIWAFLTPLQALSFPWRFLMITGIAATILLPHLDRKIILAIIFLSIVVSIPFAQFKNSENPDKYLRQNILTVDDFRPDTVPQKLVVKNGFKSAPQIYDNFTGYKMKKLNHTIIVTANRAGSITLPVFYFPNWRSISPIHADSRGLIKLTVSQPGRIVVYYGKDKNQMIGYWITIISLLAVILIGIYSAYDRRKNSY